ncbi:MAG: hypothetical protein DMF85_01825 [Acidobacteria bacterium]|nr:MAG: hypothetical protein DMF85_01825 [Acidobacteriota bacterium]
MPSDTSAVAIASPTSMCSCARIGWTFGSYGSSNGGTKIRASTEASRVSFCVNMNQSRLSSWPLYL